MSRAGEYRIEDEPSSVGIPAIVVNPMWPLLAAMLAGSWLGLTWLAINSFALGSPRRYADLGLALAGFAGASIIAFGVIVAAEQQWLDHASVRYAMLAVVAWKLVLAYAIAMRQSPVLELYEYFGGQVRNGVFVMLAAAFIGRPLLANAELPMLAKIVLL
jgi:hypothetical protein